MNDENRDLKVFQRDMMRLVLKTHRETQVFLTLTGIAFALAFAVFVYLREWSFVWYLGWASFILYFLVPLARRRAGDSGYREGWWNAMRIAVDKTNDPELLAMLVMGVNIRMTERQSISTVRVELAHLERELDD